MTQPALIAHADWSKDPRKRWVTVARWSRNQGRYDAEAPRPVGPTGELLESLRVEADGPVLVGFDFPIGLPSAYARTAEVNSFREVLPKLGREPPWTEFFEVAKTKRQIAPQRPFYPWAPGGRKRDHLVQALEFESADALYRECERKVVTSNEPKLRASTASGKEAAPASRRRPAACPLFWTLGPNQVGRAAIAGWREALQPALRSGADVVGLWPFDGALPELLETRKVILCETYPAEAYRHLGLTSDGGRWSKRKVEDRARLGPQLERWAQSIRIALHRDLLQQMSAGFGVDSHGEDRFDATVGLLSMIGVARGAIPESRPLTPEIRQVEGWILGML